jgi:glutathione S-transferase
MIKVHHLADSRSQRVLWLLEELGLDYEIIRYERDPQTMLAPASLRAIHPLGKSPVIEDGSVVVAETGAVVEYLLDTYDVDAKLRPKRGTEAGRQYTYWLHYAEGSAMPPLLLKLIFGQLPKRAPLIVRPLVRSISAKANAAFIGPQVKTHADWQEAALTRTGWFSGEAFSAADIMMSFPLEAAATRAIARSDYPHIDRFLSTIHSRPAWVRALAKGGDYAYG